MALVGMKPCFPPSASACAEPSRVSEKDDFPTFLSEFRERAHKDIGLLGNNVSWNSNTA